MSGLKFNKKELLGLLYTVIIFGFIFSFKEWGTKQFDVSVGIANLIIAMFLVALTFFIKIGIQKKLAYRFGFSAEYSPWVVGLIITLLLILVTNGWFIFLALGSLSYTVVEHMRIGHERRSSHITSAMITAVGLTINILLAAICKIFAAGSFGIIFTELMKINLWMAFYGIIPIPYLKTGHILYVLDIWEKIYPSEALDLLYTSRWGYAGIVAFVAFSTLSILYLPLWYGIIATLFLSIITWVLYYVTFEQDFIVA